MTSTESPETAPAGASLGNVDTAIERALTLLDRTQLPSGGIPVSLARDEALTVDCVDDPSIFPTALVANSLSFSTSPQASAIVARAISFLERETAGHGLWVHWPHDHPRYGLMPPDIDDTAVVSALLRRHGRRSPDNRQVLLANRDPRGLFYTWITIRFPPSRSLTHCRIVLPQVLSALRIRWFWKYTPATPRDVDAIGNANLLFYLGEIEETRPVVAHLLDVLDRKAESSCDKWYVNPFVFYYFVSRALAAGVTGLAPARAVILSRLEAATNADGSIGATSLDCALALATLLDLNVPDVVLDRAVMALLRLQSSSGGWPKVAFYLGKSTAWWGSEELVTGVCVEALARYRHLRSAEPESDAR